MFKSRSTEIGMMALTCSLSTWGLRQEDYRFEVYQVYIASSNLARTT